MAGQEPEPFAISSQRLDRWLWHARVVRTRSAAAALIGAGHVRIDGQHVRSPAHMVRVGQVLTVALDRRVRVLAVTGFSSRRQKASAGQGLYREILAPKAPSGG